MADLALRPRSAIELIDLTLAVARRYYGQLLVIFTLCMLPIAAMAGMMIVAVSRGVYPYALFGLLLVVELMVVPFMLGMFSAAGLDALLHSDVDVVRAFLCAKRHFGGIFAALFLMMLVAALAGGILFAASMFFGPFMGMLGALVLLVLSIWAWIPLIIVPAAIVHEEVGPIEAIRRSFVLMDGARGRVIGAYLLATIIIAVLLLTLMFGVDLVASPLVAQIASTVVQVLVMPALSTLPALVYLDQRVRKEGFDLDVMAQRSVSAPRAGHAGIGGSRSGERTPVGR